MKGKKGKRVNYFLGFARREGKGRKRP